MTKGASGRRRKSAIFSIKGLINECTDGDRSEWPTDTRTVLHALHRARHSRQKEVRQAIAGAFLEIVIAASGWDLCVSPAGILPYGVLIEKNGKSIRIAIVAPQWNTEKSKRLNFANYQQGLHDFEFQKKPQKAKAKDSIAIKQNELAPPDVAAESLFEFTAFDILAVNMHAITRRWADFRYTLSPWLRSDDRDNLFVNRSQSVSLPPNEIWRDDLSTCLEWTLERKQQMR